MMIDARAPVSPRVAFYDDDGRCAAQRDNPCVACVIGRRASNGALMFGHLCMPRPVEMAEAEFWEKIAPLERALAGYRGPASVCEVC